MMTYLFLLAVAILAVADRLYLQRGAVIITKADVAPGSDGAGARVTLGYDSDRRPSWSQVRFRLVDRKNPTTVIHGVPRPLEFLKPRSNAEYLSFPPERIEDGDWDLVITIESTAVRFNPLYRLCPVKTELRKSIRMGAK